MLSVRSLRDRVVISMRDRYSRRLTGPTQIEEILRLSCSSREVPLDHVLSSLKLRLDQAAASGIVFLDREVQVFILYPPVMLQINARFIGLFCSFVHQEYVDFKGQSSCTTLVHGYHGWHVRFAQ